MKKKNKDVFNILHVIFLTLLIGIVLSFPGCGGDDDDDGDSSPSDTSYIISGVAAAGAPIIGTVTIKDATGTEKVVTIEADGSYSIDVSDLTAPFALRADGYVGGTEYHLYSAAISADINGTINITPFTDLIIANIAGQIAEEYYDSDAFADLTEEELEAAETALQELLEPILTAIGLEDTIDLLRTAFSTDHTGLDAIIDVVKVTVDPDTVKATLTNILNSESIVVDIAEGGSTSDIFTDEGVSEGITALEAMAGFLDTFTQLFASSLPDPESETLLALFDSDEFLESGETLDSWLSGMTSESSMIGISFTNLVLVSYDPDAGVAEVSFDIVQSGVTENSGVCRMIRSDEGLWLFAGNGRIADVSVQTMAQYFPNESGTQLYTGLNLTIEANYPAGADVESAVVTGPGLPTEGVVLNRQINFDWFAISDTERTTNLYAITDDDTIDEIPENAEYTIVLMDQADGAGNELATYTETILKGPVKLSELTVDSFPAITSPTTDELAEFSGGSLSVEWTLPSGLGSHDLELTLADTDWTNSSNVRETPEETDTSATLSIDTPDFTVNIRQLGVNAIDGYQRRFYYQLTTTD